MTREEMRARWVARWRGARSSGLKMSQYARQEGFSACSAYRWRRKARRTGQWSDAPKAGKSIAVAKQPQSQPVQFARVTVSDLPRASASILLRVLLTNGRRAELELGGMVQLGEVIDVLERRA